MRRGFAMVEVLLASAIAVVVGFVLVNILSNNTSVFYQQNALVSGNLSLNDTTAELTNQIKQASAVTLGYPESLPNFTTDAKTLVFKSPAVNVDGVIPNVYDYTVISADQAKPKVLKMQLFPDSQSTRKAQTRVLTAILDSIQFEYLDKTGAVTAPISAVSIRVTLTVGYQNGSINKKSSSNFVVGLRNSTL